MDFVHKLLVALVGILGTISVYTYNNIADRMTDIHNETEHTKESMIRIEGTLQYLQKDVSKVDAKVKEHLYWTMKRYKTTDNKAHTR